MADFSLAYPKISKDEGGFQQNPADQANYCGGMLIGTNRGISAVAYKGYFGVCPSVEAMKAITVETAKAIYKKNYWDRLNLDKVKNQSVAAMMMQYIIGSGASQVSDIKSIANKTGNLSMPENDNVPTDEEIRKINGLNQKKFWDNLKAWRHDFYTRIIAANPSLKQFETGWRKRLDSYVYEETSKKKIFLILGVTAVVLIGTSFAFKRVDWKWKLLASAAIIGMVFGGIKLYDKYQNNRSK